MRLVLLQWLMLTALASPALAAPDEQFLGKAAGYPLGKPANWFFDESVRVGSFSNLDRILPHHTLEKSATPLKLPKAASEPNIEYRFEDLAPCCKVISVASLFADAIMSIHRRESVSRLFNY